MTKFVKSLRSIPQRLATLGGSVGYFEHRLAVTYSSLEVSVVSVF